jgi:hypothetical protein
MAQLAVHLMRISNQRELTLRILPSSSPRIDHGRFGETRQTQLHSVKNVQTYSADEHKWQDAVIALRLSYLAATYYVLPPAHMDGRKMHPIKHALYAVIKKIYEA